MHWQAQSALVFKKSSLETSKAASAAFEEWSKPGLTSSWL
jgi:hypothetical protein